MSKNTLYNRMKQWIRDWVPHPILSLVLVLLWIALQNSLSYGNLILAAILGVLIPLYTANFWPDRPQIDRPLLALTFVAILLFDIVVATIHVAYLVAFKPVSKLRTGWLSMPLELQSPESIAALMATITLTPGTISGDLSSDGRFLLIHCLDIDDAESMVTTMKQRYERRLKVIFP